MKTDLSQEGGVSSTGEGDERRNSEKTCVVQELVLQFYTKGMSG